MKQGAIFDMDGTLFDTERFYVRAWVETADDFGVERVPSLGLEMSGTNLEQAKKVFAKHYGGAVDVQKYFKKVVEKVSRWAEEELAFLPGAAELVEYLYSQKILLAIASGSPHALIEKNLRRKGLDKFFSAIIGGDDISRGKPNPDMFLAAAEKLKISPRDCYVFEDSFNGIRAAHAAECLPIMIPNQLQPTDEIKKICGGVYSSLLAAMTAIKNGEI